MATPKSEDKVMDELLDLLTPRNSIATFVHGCNVPDSLVPTSHFGAFIVHVHGVVAGQTATFGGATYAAAARKATEWIGDYEGQKITKRRYGANSADWYVTEEERTGTDRAR